MKGSFPSFYSSNFQENIIQDPLVIAQSYVIISKQTEPHVMLHNCPTPHIIVIQPSEINNKFSF